MLLHLECPHCHQQVSVQSDQLQVDREYCHCGCDQIFVRVLFDCPHCGQEVFLYDDMPDV